MVALRLLLTACAAGRAPAPSGTEAASQRAGESDSARVAIGKLIEAQQEAWNRGDLEGFMSGYWNSPDLVFTSGGQVERGYTTLLERYRATYGSGAALGRLDFSDLEVHPLGDGSAWALGRWRLGLASDTLGGVFTLVLERFEGEWKIVHDHTSRDAPAAEAASP